MKTYDVIVIGGGGAGLSAAFTAAGFGKKTMLVEKNKTGGECTWNGCIPSKAMIHLAELAHAAALTGSGTVKQESPFQKIDDVRQAVYAHESPEVLAQRGVDTLIGEARFTGPDTIEVNGESYRAKRFIVAVGSRALVPPVPGLADTPHITNETLFDLKALPKSVLVMGGGPIGLEMAQALSRLGVEITVVEMLDRILFREDPDTAEVIREKLVDEGVMILTGAKAVNASTTPNGVQLTVETDGRKANLEAESLLVAVGRRSGAGGLNLEAAGVKTTPKGVEVDKRLRTSNPRIYAAGDVAGPYAFSHMAEYQGVKAAMNAILPFKSKVNYNHVAWATFTDPEIARAGMTEDEARQKYGKRVKVYTHRYEDLDRGRTVPGTKGLVKIILGPRSRILGAHIAGERAGELISEIQVMKTLGIGYHKLRGVIHPYPTYADILRQIAKKVALDRILDHPVVRLFRGSKGDTDGS
ncbi:MAG: FAD-dependent oxidoreductase [Spirochaetaceae bacterium]|nr:FAD-dependent oxidoreductase [Spirochaetaceae bacterium]MDT8297011.1 FAD-dependent oxidoreductase [Spirochaetaceae bacterium]